MRLQNNYDGGGFCKSQVRNDLKAMDYRAYRDGSSQLLNEAQKKKRVECALKGSRLLLKWEHSFGLERKFQLLWHSDEKIFPVLGDQKLYYSWEKQLRDKFVRGTVQGPEKTHIWMACNPYWGCIAVQVPEDFSVNQVIIIRVFTCKSKNRFV